MSDDAFKTSNDVAEALASAARYRLTKPSERSWYEETIICLADVVGELVSALKQCSGLLCESGDLNNYRNLSDEELGKAWVETARKAANLLNRLEGLPHETS